MSDEASIQSDIDVTEAAADEIRRLIALEDEPEGKGLRLYIEQGGCSGMQYGMVFDEHRENDSISEVHNVRVYVDPVSLKHLKGALVDFSDDLNESGFKISNPNATQSCGCGRSFQA